MFQFPIYLEPGVDRNLIYWQRAEQQVPNRQLEDEGHIVPLAVVPQIVPHIAPKTTNIYIYTYIKSIYIYIGGICWYICRILSQGYPTFPLINDLRLFDFDELNESIWRWN